ncbi:MAG: site-specific tyrosine recombinase/integron integrase [Candidatus Woesearchaeota archaeon]
MVIKRGEMNVKEALLVELKLRGFSPRTIKSYIYQNSKFLEYIKKEPRNVAEEDIKAYMAFLISDRGMAPSSVALAKAALKFYFYEVLKKNIVNIKTPKMFKKLPVILTKEEVKRLIDSASTKKTRLILMLLYASGLRVSEAVSLKYGDLEPDDNFGWVRLGKGGKDRMFLLNDRLVKELNRYSKDNSGPYIFSNALDEPISPRNVQKIVSKTAKKAGIKKRVTPHTLRHSFATHLLESGVSIRYIQELLGHSNLQTTQIYTKVSTDELRKIKSPLDGL